MAYNLKAEEELELARRARRGDADAFGRLALGHRARIRGLLHRLLGSGEVDDAEQDVFLAAWRGIRRFRGDAAFGTWLTRIAVHRALRVLERRSKRPEPIAREPRSERAGPAERAIAAEQNGRVLAAVDALSPKLRVAFVLRYVEGMTGEEVARVLDVPAGTVRSRLFEARRRLATELAEEIGE